MWIAVFVVLLLLAALDLTWLWKTSRSRERQIFSPFTLASQALFAILAAIHIGPLAFESFSIARAVQITELSFVGLMLLGFVVDIAWLRARGRESNG